MIDVNVEPTLPTPSFCALMAFERLKDDGSAEAALAWATLGTLVLSISSTIDIEEFHLAIDEFDLAVAVANAAAGLAKDDTPKNKSALRKALVDWMDRAKKS
jgi:hypothetical protein